MKKFVLPFLCAFGVHRFAAWWNRKSVIILCYHGITENSNRYRESETGQDVHRDNFAAQLDYLKQRYRIISLDQYLSALRERRPLPDYSVVLTFDDGPRNIATVAAPLLAQRNLPSSVFVITDTLSKGNGAKGNGILAQNDDETFLSWTDAKELERKQPITFESHTCSHPNLLGISKEEVSRELSDSRNALKANLRGSALAFAYPYGQFSPALAEKVREAGYQCALTILGGPNSTKADPYALRRVVISHEEQGSLFAARVSCLTWWLNSLGGRLSRGNFFRRRRFLLPLFDNETCLTISPNEAATGEDM